jgi:hypothetical protein
VEESFLTCIRVRDIEGSEDKYHGNCDIAIHDFPIIKRVWATSIKRVDRCRAASAYRHIENQGSARQVDFQHHKCEIPTGRIPDRNKKA